MNLKSGCAKFLVFTALLLLCFVFMWGCFNFVGGSVKPGRPVVSVGAETTVLTSPLDANGDVDYLEAINQQLSQGVTPENNAMVLIVQATGPIAEGERLPDEFFQRLGVSPPPVVGNYFQNPHEWLDANRELAPQTEEDFDAILDRHFEFARENPWKVNDFPIVNRWLDEMQEPLELVRQASKRPRLYHPMVSPDPLLRVLSCRLSLVQTQRSFARALSVSAMRHLEQGEIDQCQQELMTIYRLGHLATQGNTLVEQLVGMAMVRMADQLAVNVAASEKASRQELLGLRDAISGLPSLDNMVDSLDNLERFMALDTIVSTARGGSGILNSINATRASNETSPVMDTALRTVDWGQAMRVTNRWYDKLVAIAKIEDNARRAKTFADLEKELMMTQANIKTGSNIALTLLGGRKAKGRMYGEILIGMLLPASRAVDESLARSRSYRSMTQLALALAAYKIDQEKFPDSLDALVPEYVNAVPVDDFTSTPFTYRVLDSGSFELYSLGSDGLDDGGQSGRNPSDWPIEFGIKTWEDFKYLEE